MAISFSELREMLLLRRPLFVYATAWTALVMTTVAAASFLPELAFSWAVMPSSAFSRAGQCDSQSLRLPMDGPPGEVVCLPAHLFGRSKLDLLVPPVFAAAMVAGSACFVRAIGLWESEDEDDEEEMAEV